MDRNFDLRRQMFGDAALGALNLRMVLAARALGGALCASLRSSIVCSSVGAHMFA